MKRPSTDLHVLISSMSSGELKFVHGRLRDMDSTSRTMFEVLRQQESYDEAALRARLDAGITRNQFSVAKHYLYHTLLSYLVQYKQNSRSALDIRARLQGMEVLYSRELYDQCWKVLKRIEKAVEQMDDPWLMHEVLHWKNRLYDRSYHKVEPDEFAAHLKRFRENIQAVEEHGTHRLLLHDFLYQLRNQPLLRRQEGFVEGFDSFFQNPMLTAGRKAGSVPAEILYHFTRGIYAFMAGKMENALHNYQQIIALMDAHPGWKKRSPDAYIDAIHRLGIVAFNLHQMEVVADVLKKMAAFRDDRGYVRARLFFYRSQLHRAYLLIYGTRQEIFEAIRRTEAEFPEHVTVLTAPEVLTYRFNNGMALMGASKFELAARQLQALLNSDAVRKYSEIALISKIMLMLIYLELGDRDLFRYYHRAAYRYLYRRKEQFQSERLVLAVATRIMRLDDEAEKRALWAQLVDDLRQAEDFQARSIEYFDYTVWARSRAEACDFLEVWQEIARAQIETTRAQKKN